MCSFLKCRAQATWNQPPAIAGTISKAGVPSASSTGGHGDPAAYNLFRIEKDGDAWRCEATTRGFRRTGSEIVPITTRMLN